MKRVVLLLAMTSCAAAAQVRINGSRVLEGSLNYCVDAGTTDAYGCSLSPAITSYVAGARYAVKVNTANTGPASLSLNGLAAIPIRKYQGGMSVELSDNDIRAGQIVEVAYDGTAMQLQSTLGNGGSNYTLPTASASQLGGVKVGANLSIDGNGVMSAAGGASPVSVTIVEEFISGSTSSLQIGQHGWRFDAFTSGTFAWAAPEASHPGVVTITTTTTANTGGALGLANNSSRNQIHGTDLGGKDWEVSWIVKLNTVAGSRARIGLAGTGAVAADSNSIHVFFRYDEDAAYADNGKNGGTGSWVGQWCGSGNNCGDTGGGTVVLNVAPDTNWHKFTVTHTGADNRLAFKIDGGTTKTICAIGCDASPALFASGSQYSTPTLLFGTSNTTQKSIAADWMGLTIGGLVR